MSSLENGILRGLVRFLFCLVFIFAAHGVAQTVAPVVLEGYVRDLAGSPIAGIRVTAGTAFTATASDGHYRLVIPAGDALLRLQRGDGTFITVTLQVAASQSLDLTLGAGDTVTVAAQADSIDPDPAAQVFPRSDTLDANPARPGVPISIPGLPVETASGGIKAPQYFAPGVAGDHGEPIAQYIAVSSYLLQNNLTANAHGNGYSDPNFLVSGVIDGAVVDAGAFNARYGDHSVNLAVTYDLRLALTDSVQGSTNGKDGALGFTRHLGKSGWLAAEALFGNGWLNRPEERQQYKLNLLNTWTPGRHELTLFGVGYYGFSRIPGLIPIDVAVPSETVDSRQSDLTHTTIATLVDRWQIDHNRSLTTGAFFRTYSLDLRSNFGDGLIQQSEFRTVAGGSSTFEQNTNARLTFLAGLEERREAPRGLDLNHFNEATSAFTPVASNNLTIYTTAPFAAATGRLLPALSYYAGGRWDELCFDNQDVLTPANSFHRCQGLLSPKLTFRFGEPVNHVYPELALSFGKAFHANDPRIGTGSTQGQLLSVSREFQAVVSKQVHGLEGRVLLGQVSTSAEFGQIDADTGLQEDVGPGLNRYLTAELSQRLLKTYWRASWSEADARDRSDGSPIPEAPRMIADGLFATSKLPAALSAKAEFEYVKAKPLGDGFTGLPLTELRLNLTRSFNDGQWTASLDGQWMHGFSGQTTETIGLNGGTAFERPVGVPVASYATLSLRYNFKR